VVIEAVALGGRSLAARAGGHGVPTVPAPRRVANSDDAFARWDRSHLHEFTRADGYRLGIPSGEDWDLDHLLDYAGLTLGRLSLGEQFAYVFDCGDDWQYLCTVGPRRIDPLQTLRIVPDHPLPYFGWGDIPDQYRRRWDSDDGESPPPRKPKHPHLPPLLPGWGEDLPV